MVQLGVNNCQDTFWIEKVLDRKRTKIEALRGINMSLDRPAKGKAYFILVLSKTCEVPLGIAYKFTDRHHRSISTQLFQVRT
jgi:hypothetical protein